MKNSSRFFVLAALVSGLVAGVSSKSFAEDGRRDDGDRWHHDDRRDERPNNDGADVVAGVAGGLALAATTSAAADANAAAPADTLNTEAIQYESTAGQAVRLPGPILSSYAASQGVDTNNTAAMDQLASSIIANPPQ